MNPFKLQYIKKVRVKLDPENVSVSFLYNFADKNVSLIAPIINALINYLYPGKKSIKCIKDNIKGDLYYMVKTILIDMEKK